MQPATVGFAEFVETGNSYQASVRGPQITRGPQAHGRNTVQAAHAQVAENHRNRAGQMSVCFRSNGARLIHPQPDVHA